MRNPTETSAGRPLRLALVVSIAAVLSLAAMGAAQPIKERADEGRAALRQGRYREALALFEQGLEISRETADAGDWLDKLEFYKAVTLQQEGMSLEKDPGSAAAAAESLRRAAGVYASLLERNPDSGVTLNNLAKTWEALGDGERAKEHYRRAIALDDERRDLYLQNYAQLLDELGERTRATTVYAALAERQPTSSKLQAEVIHRLLEQEPDALVAYLWGTLNQGRILRAQEGAVLALEADSSSAVDELLAIVAASLSRQVYEPAEFADSPVAQRLRRLTGAAADGAAGILDAHLGPERTSAYSWWQERDDLSSEPSGGMRPVEAFRKLHSSLGDKHRAAGGWQTAEAYYRLALKLWSGQVDTKSFRALTSLYAGRGELDKVDRLAREYTRKIFREKGLAYTFQDKGKIFEYHMTLGELYSVLRRWGSEDSIPSAIFQLGTARKNDPERFPPHAAMMLSEAYAETGRLRDSYDVRFKQAKVYAKAGNTGAAQAVLQDLRGRELPAEIPEQERLQYQSMLSTIPEVPATSLPEVTASGTATATWVVGEAATLTESRKGLVLGRRLAPTLTPELDSLYRGVALLLQPDGGASSRVDWSGLGVDGGRVSYDGEGKGLVVFEYGGTEYEVPFRHDASGMLTFRQGGRDFGLKLDSVTLTEEAFDLVIEP